MCVSIAYASLVVGVLLVTYIGITCELDDPLTFLGMCLTHVDGEH